MEKWLIFAGSGMVASFIGYVLYTHIEKLADDPSAANIFAVVGMAGLILILAATALQRARS